MLKTLEEFDFTFQPSLDVKLIKALANCEFVEKHETILSVEPPGVGKSHLATALGVKACMRGYSVLFTTIQHLASQLSSAIAHLSVEKLITQYVDADLIVLDELGPHVTQQLRRRREHVRRRAQDRKDGSRTRTNGREPARGTR